MDENVTVTKINRSYQVFRGMSPTTSSRLELRVKELEDALDFERDSRLRAEKQVTELSFQLESVNERLEEAGGQSIQYVEISRKRDAEITKLRKDLDQSNAQLELAEQAMRKRYTNQIAELQEMVDALTRQKNKSEKDRSVLIIEVDNISTQLDSALKAKASAESKLDGYDSNLNRLKQQVDELSRQVHDLTNAKQRLTAENFELQHQVQDLDSANASLNKIKTQLQISCDDYKRALEEEKRERQSLSIQITNIQTEYESLVSRFEDESEGGAAVRNQLSRITTELSQIKSRYEKDLMARTEELEETRRRLNARIHELEDVANQATARASGLEKTKGKLLIEIKEITSEVEILQQANGDLSKRVKAAESALNELQRRYDDLHGEHANLQSDHRNALADIMKLKSEISTLADKRDQLDRECRTLAEQLKEANGHNKDLTRQISELTIIKSDLEAQRNSLQGALSDAEERLRDLEAKLQSTSNALAVLQTEMQNRLREKDDELENIRKTSQRAIEELNRQLIDLESKYKSDMNRLKKKYETTIHEIEINIETLTRANSDLNKQLKGAGSRLKEIEILYEEEKSAHDLARSDFVAAERKRAALQAELEELRGLLEASERARKALDAEREEAATRISELTISITTLSNDKRRMEQDFSGMHADLDAALNAQRAAEDRAASLANEVHRLQMELGQEQENYRNADELRKKLEIEIREITVRLEEAEAFAHREGKKMIAKLQSRIRDLEGEFENEQRRHREAIQLARKYERMYKEIHVQYEDNNRTLLDLQDLLDKTNAKMKQYKRMMEEAEEVTAITLGKYRKAQAQIEEAENRADLAERINVRGRAGGRSVSVHREVHRVIRS